MNRETFVENVIYTQTTFEDITEHKQAEEEIHRRADEFSALYDTARDLAAQQDLATLLDTIAERARQLVGTSSSEVCLYDPIRNDLELVVAKGYTPPDNRRLQMGEGSAGKVAQTHQPIIVDDYHTWSGRSLKYEETPLSSCIEVPMLHRGELIGAIGLGDIAPQSHQFTDADTRLLTLFATQAASAVRNARLLAETRTRAARLAALNAIVTSANRAGTDLKALLEVALDHTLQALGMEKGGIWLSPTSGEDLVFAVRGFPEEIGAAARQSVEAQQIDLSNIITRDDLLAIDSPTAKMAASYGIRAIIAAPLIAAGKRVGSLSLVSEQPHQWSDEEIALLEAIGRELGTAAERARLFEETRRRLDELEAVNRISTALRAAQTLDEMLPRLLNETLAVLSTDAGSIWLYDQASNALHKRIESGWLAPTSQVPIKPGEGISGSVFATGEAYVSREYATDPRTHPVVRKESPVGWGGACVPIRTADEVIGVFFASVQLPRELTPSEVHLLTTIAEIAGNSIHRTRLHDQTQQHLQRLASLHTIDQAISASLDLRVTLDVLLNQVISQLRVDAAAILLLKLPTQMLEYAAGRGFRSNAIARSRLRIGDDFAGRAALERQMINVPDLRSTESAFARAQLLADERFVTYFGVPLVAKGQIKGVLEIFHRTPLHPDRDWLEYLKTFAGQAAIAIDNAEMFENLQRSNAELVLAYDTTLEGWSRALDLRDKETEGHTQRVAETALRFANALEIEGMELGHIRRGALLHDIGKMGISDTILLKPGPLTEEEWGIMRRHPTYAYELLSPIGYLRPSLDIPYCHHEKWDGTGYPRGLKGDEIPLAARIFAVVDVWDALRSDRPYRAALSATEALEYIRAQAGKHFDPRVAEVFLHIIENDA